MMSIVETRLAFLVQSYSNRPATAVSIVNLMQIILGAVYKSAVNFVEAIIIAISVVPADCGNDLLVN